MSISRISRACDSCRLRKVRCQGCQPCSQCSHLDLPCIFTKSSVKRKPPVRGRLVAQLRGEAATPSGSNGRGEAKKLAPSSGGGHVAVISPPVAPTSPASPLGSRTSSALASPLDVTSPQDAVDDGSYTPDFFYSLFPEFEKVVYPVNPILSADEIRESIDNMRNSHEDAALAYAFGGVTINLARTSSSPTDDVRDKVTDLVRRSIVAHRRADMSATSSSSAYGGGHGSIAIGELPVSVKRIMTCVYLEICAMSIRQHARSFNMIREAISMLQTLNTNQRRHGEDPLDAAEVSRRQRLYWELYIHERFFTMTSGCPSMLAPLSTGPPYRDPTIPKHIDVGFSCLISLFSVIDDDFLNHWTALHDASQPAPKMTAHWIEMKQAELDRDEAAAVEKASALAVNGEGGLTELQHADLFVTRLFFRTLVWQLALSQGLLSSTPSRDSHQGLSLHFPARRLSSDLRSLVSRLGSVASIGTHGSGILQKLFEITSTVADVLALPLGSGSDPDVRAQEEADLKTQLEDFVYLVRFLFSFERIQEGQRRYLREKLEGLQEMYTVVDFGELALASPVSCKE